MVRGTLHWQTVERRETLRQGKMTYKFARLQVTFLGTWAGTRPGCTSPASLLCRSMRSRPVTLVPCDFHSFAACKTQKPSPHPRSSTSDGGFFPNL